MAPPWHRAASTPAGTEPQKCEPYVLVGTCPSPSHGTSPSPQSFPVPSTARAQHQPGGLQHHGGVLHQPSPYCSLYERLFFFNSPGFRMIFQAAYRSTCIFNMYIEKLDFILLLKSSFYSIVFNFAGIKDLILLHKIISYAVSALNNRDIY